MGAELTILPQPKRLETAEGALAVEALAVRSEFQGELVDGGIRFVAAFRDARRLADGCEPAGNETLLTIRKSAAELSAGSESYVLEISPRGIALDAGEPIGVFRGLTTLSELMGTRGGAELPCCRIEDGADMEERGVFFCWGVPDIYRKNYGDIVAYFTRLARLKMNAVCFQILNSTGLLIPSGEFPTGAPDTVLDQTERLVGDLRALGFRVFGYVPHMDSMAAWDSKFVGSIVSHSGERRGICFSKPDTAELLLRVTAEVASRLPLDGISFWLEEVQDGCRCPQCMKKPRFMPQCDAILHVKERISEKIGRELPIRVLLTQGSFKYNRAIVERLPKDITFEYYFGDLYGDEVPSTYGFMEPRIIPRHVRELAAEGYRFVCVPNYSAMWGSRGYPLIQPGLVAGKLAEIRDGGLKGSIGWCPWPDAAWHNLAVAGAVSWNADDNDVTSILRRWVVRADQSDPERYAEVVQKLEPLSRYTLQRTSMMWSTVLRNPMDAIAERMARLFIPDHLDLEYADILFREDIPGLSACIRQAKEAVAQAAGLEDPWLRSVARAAVLFGEVLLNWYRAYYVYVRERDIDTFAGRWGNWRDEVRGCLDKISGAVGEFSELWPQVMARGDREAPCRFSAVGRLAGKVRASLNMIERPGFEPQL